MGKVFRPKPLGALGGVVWLLLAADDIGNALNVLPALPIRLHEVALVGAVTLTALAAFSAYTAKSVAPVREAFLFGFKLAAQQRRDREEMADSADPGGKVLHLPPSVYTVGNTAINAQAQVPVQRPSPRPRHLR